ncbi:MAG: PAS domain-containing protein [Planctomycetaceae bacterium]|nr:PAS domain-containing protein [Planctomycetaceae bacterium]
MFRWLTEIVDVQGFPALWSSGTAWEQQPWWGWMHIAADVATWAAYVAIPLVILRFVRHRRDIPLSRVFWLFGAFLLASGTMHLLDALMFWWPAYRLSALLKLATAVVSWATVLCLLRVIPQALAFRSPRALELEVDERTRQLQQMTDRLQEEVVERRRVAANLLTSEEQLQLALQAGGMGTWDWDLTTDRVRFNPTQVELLGLGAPDGAIDADAFFEILHPDDRAGVTQAIEAAIRLHRHYDHEFRIRTPNGDTRWLGGRGEVIRDATGTPVRMMGVNFDISRRKQDEEALRLRTRAIEFATNGIVITDALQADCPIVFANPAFEELTGYTAHESVGQNCRFLQGPDTDPDVSLSIRLAIQQRRECAVTILNYRKDGTPFWNDLRIAPIFDEHDEVTHFVGIQSDVTERIDAEYELDQAREAAEAANRAKSRFLASMSHEIRTPLTAVLGCADVLCRRIVAGTDRELALVIRNQGESLLQLLNDVLDLSKIEAGKIELRYESCDLRALIDGVRKLVEPMAGEKGIALRMEVEDSLPVTLQLDPLRVRQILLNLLSNSVKFTDAGRVELFIRRDPSPKSFRLQIELRDTGVGIPADRIAEMFQEFSQVEIQQGDRGPGTGLGLAIVRKLIKLHGGTIAVDSVVGEGTTFRIVLPVREDDLSPVEPDAATPLPGESAGSGGDRLACRLLIAEDTRSLQFMLRRMLDDQVASITIVGNGAEAVEAVHRSAAELQPIDLVLMDMQMPILNGYEATQRLRSEGFAGAIIALTAGAMEGERTKCLAAGCTDYLPKPLDREQLLRTLRKYSSPLADGR